MKAIGTNRYMQLVGLLTVANLYTRRIDDVKRAICDVLDVDANANGPADHVSDAVWGYPTDDAEASVRQLLGRLNIEVLK